MIQLNPNRKITLNPAQVNFVLNLSKFMTSIWGRGTGKSFIIAYLIHMIVKHMPRSSWGIVGRTFAQMLEITLLPTIYALEKFGYVMDHDFFIRKRPSDKLNFTKPLKPVTKYDYVITFYNGTTFHLISQDRNSRGTDLQGLIIDEALNINKLKFDEQIVPGIRGFKDEFGHIPFYRAHFYFSSMPNLTEGKWLLDHGHYYLNDGNDLDIINKKLIKLQLAFIDHPDSGQRKELLRLIIDLKKKLRYYRSKHKWFYSESNVFDNLGNVGIEYIEDLRRTMLDLTFRIEILNEKIPSIINGFYCNLNDDDHLYDQYDYSHIDAIGYDRRKFINKDCRFDADLDKHKPLYLGIDPGGHINVCTVAQNFPDELRFLNCFHRKNPDTLRHMLEDFNNYYKFHKKKMIKLSVDVGSKSQQQFETSKTLADKSVEFLQSKGWTVENISQKKLSHQERYDLINEMYLQSKLSITQRKYKTISYHRYNCLDLLISLRMTEIKKGSRIYEKNKAGEKDSNKDQLREPHLSDAHDYTISDIMKPHYRRNRLDGLSI